MPPARTDSHFSRAASECAAWLYLPEGEGPHPCVVMAHGFSAVREQRLDAYAERFAAAGLAALVFDYRHFGASAGPAAPAAGHPRASSRTGAPRSPTPATCPASTRRRVAVWGSSFSGGHVVAVAAEDPDIAAVVSQAPFTTGSPRSRPAAPARRCS